MISVAHEPVAAPLGREIRRRDSVVARVARLFAVWLWRARSRTQLARLSERELRDIGLAPADAARECAKPFWRG